MADNGEPYNEEEYEEEETTIGGEEEEESKGGDQTNRDAADVEAGAEDPYPADDYLDESAASQDQSALTASLADPGPAAPEPVSARRIAGSSQRSDSKEPRPPSGTRQKDPSPRTVQLEGGENEDGVAPGGGSTADIDLSVLAGPVLSGDVVAKLHEENKVLREQLKNFNEALNSKLANPKAHRPKPRRPPASEASELMLTTKLISEKRTFDMSEFRDKTVRNAQKQADYYRKINQDLQRHIDNSVHATKMIEMENKIVDQARTIARLQAENKTLHADKLQSDKALLAEVGLNEEYPKKLRMLTEDNRVLKDKLRKYVERAGVNEKTSKQQREQMLKLSDRCKKLAEILKVKGLDGFIGFDEAKAAEEKTHTEKMIADLTRNLEIETNARSSDRRKFKREAQDAGAIIDRLRVQLEEAQSALAEKDKDLKLALMKAKGRTARSPQPTAGHNAAPIPHPDIPAKPTTSPSTNRTVNKEASLPHIKASTKPPEANAVSFTNDSAANADSDDTPSPTATKKSSAAKPPPTKPAATAPVKPVTAPVKPVAAVPPRSATQSTGSATKTAVVAEIAKQASEKVLMGEYSDLKGDFEPEDDEEEEEQEPKASPKAAIDHPDAVGATEFVSEPIHQNVDLRHPKSAGGASTGVAEGGGRSAHVIGTPSQPVSAVHSDNDEPDTPAGETTMGATAVFSGIASGASSGGAAIDTAGYQGGAARNTKPSFMIKKKKKEEMEV